MTAAPPQAPDAPSADATADGIESLGRVGDTRVAVAVNDQPWTLRIDTLAVSVGADGMGILAAEVATWLPPSVWDGVDFAKILPDQPAFFDVPEGHLPASALRRIIVATGRDPGQAPAAADRNHRLDAIGRATLAIVRSAARMGGRALGLPLLGTGAIGLSPHDVAAVAVPAARAALRSVAPSLEKLAFVCRDEATRRAIEQVWEYEELLVQAREQALANKAILAEADPVGLGEDDLRRVLDDDTVAWQPCLGQLAELRRIDAEREDLRAYLVATLDREYELLRHDIDAGSAERSSRGHRSREWLRDAQSNIDRILAENREWQQLTRQRADAMKNLHRALVESMFFQLRLAINERLQLRALTQDRRARYRETLTKVPTGDLRADPEMATLVSTTAGTELEELTALDRTLRVSVGVAGPRGCGKSTLLKSRALWEKPGIAGGGVRIFLQAPASYAPREFLTYLYSLVCEEVLKGTSAEFRPGSDPSPPARLRAASLLSLVLLPALTFATGLAILASVAARTPMTPPTLVALGGAVVVAASVALLLLGVLKRLFAPRRPTAGPDHHRYLLEVALLALFGRLSASLPGAGRLLAVAAACGAVVVGAADRITPRQIAGAILLAAAAGSAVYWIPRRGRRRLPPAQAGTSEPGGHATILRAARGVCLVMAVSAAQLVAVAAGMVLLVVPATTANVDVWLVVGGMLAAGGCAALLAGSQWHQHLAQVMQRPGPTDAYVAQAVRDLRRLRYQRSVMSGWTGAAKVGANGWLPFGVDLGASGSTTEADMPLVVPEIVDGIKRLLPARGPAVVAIDELDKIESVDKARDFLNEIKGILEAKDTRFLVSMSEDAIASFERRGLPFRDVFDSAFDEVVRVPYLNAEQARTLLNGRITGVPEPYLALAYCQSGGLPRDLIRATDRMISLAGSGEAGSPLAAIARDTIHRDLNGKRDAVTAAIKSMLVEPDVSAVLSSVQNLDVCEPLGPRRQPCLLDEHWLEPLSRLDPILHDGAVQDVPERRELLRLTVELVGYFYYCRTLLELFDVDNDITTDRLIHAVNDDRGRALDVLTRARQTFAVNPFVAWNQLSTMRTELGLAQWELPTPLCVGGRRLNPPSQGHN